MQLTFINTLYREPNKAEVNIIKNLEAQIKNLKYLRACIETKLSVTNQNTETFDKLAYANTKIGFALWWAATLGYRKNTQIRTANVQSQEEWYSKTDSKAILSASEALSTHKLYNISFEIEKLYKRLISSYRGLILSDKISEMTSDSYTNSLKDLKNTLYEARFTNEKAVKLY